MAALGGLLQAQFNLALIYDQGLGVTQDYTEALKWYRMAAAQGYAEAQHNLGNMYRQGQGVTQDDAEAAHWYRKAAGQGIVEAQNSLGSMHQGGRGVDQPDVEPAGRRRKDLRPCDRADGCRLSADEVLRFLESQAEQWWSAKCPPTQCGR